MPSQFPSLEYELHRLVAEHGADQVFAMFRQVIGCTCAENIEDEGLSHNWVCNLSESEDG